MAVNIAPQEQDILASVQLPPRPKALLAITEEARKPEPSFPAIAQAIADDVSISAMVLKVVNSAAFRRPNPIGSIDQALNLLGLKRVLAIVNAVSVRNALPSSASLDNFWEYCSTVAHSCVLVCKQLRLMAQADDAYTLGLFHGAGVPLLMTHFPDYEAFFQQAQIEGWNHWIQQENDQFHTSHTTLGALMAQDWSLPEPIVEAIYNTHYAEGLLTERDSDSTTLTLLSVLKLARHIGHCYHSPEHQDSEWLAVEEPLTQFLEIDDTEANAIIEEVLFELNNKT